MESSPQRGPGLWPNATYSVRAYEVENCRTFMRWRHPQSFHITGQTLPHPPRGEARAASATDRDRGQDDHAPRGEQHGHALREIDAAVDLLDDGKPIGVGGAIIFKIMKPVHR